MNSERLLTYYDTIAEAPDAIGSMRQFVLKLAVRGKLVKQDSNDEPASELLKLMSQEKTRLTELGEIRGLKLSSLPNDADPPYSLPRNWAWIRLCDIGRLAGGMTPSMSRAEFWNGDIVWLSPKDIKSDEVSDSEMKITARGLSETRLELYPKGSLFMVARSGILKRTFPVSVNRVAAAANQDMKVLTPFLEGQERYLQIMFKGMTEFILEHLVKTGTTVQSLKYEEFEQQRFPIPPLAEQTRIVSKVDELMSLCDNLESSRANLETTRDRLAASSLGRLNRPNRKTFPDDALFVLNALPALTKRSDQVNPFRQVILNLAVQGKLVPQDRRDEPTPLAVPRSFSAASAMDEAVFQEFRKLIFCPAVWSIAPLSLVTERIVDCPHTTPKWTATGEICVRTNQLRARKLDLSKSRFVSEQTYIQRIERLEPQVDDILYSREGGILGAACRIPPAVRLCLGQRLMLIRTGGLVRADYLEIVLNSPFITNIALLKTTGGAAPRVNMSTVRAYPIPIPPLAEQVRIVARVDDLTTICDQLEANLIIGQQMQTRLLKALLREALESADDEANPARTAA
jgi:type I restriction enzyme S subunit